MKKRGSLPVFLGLALLAAACGEDTAGPGANNNAPDFTGTWIGPANEDKGGGPYTPTLILVLSQSGASVTGSYVDSITTSYADSGGVSATVAGDSAVLTVTLNDPPPVTRCSGTLAGTFRITNGQLVGSYTGRDCDFLSGGPDPNRTATFTLTKQ